MRILTLSAVTRDEFTEENTKLTAAVQDQVADLWLEPGDVLVERSNTRELVGTAAMYRGPRRWAIFPDLMIRVRVREDVNPEYLEAVLRSSDARRYFRANARGIVGTG